MNDMEPMPMDQPSMEGAEGMGPDLGGEPMGDQPPMDGPDGNDAMPGEGSGSEIDDIFSQLDTEKQAAVIKYAKSQLGESIENEDSLVTEIENDILSDKKEDETKKEKIKNKNVDKKNSPFVTKY